MGKVALSHKTRRFHRKHLKTRYNEGMGMRVGIWDVLGSPNQTFLVRRAIDRCDFPFEKLVPKLKSDALKEAIPVEWADLSRYLNFVAAPSSETNVPHIHVHEGGDTGHGILHRNRVLGLAWYSGRVSLDISLEATPELAQEVFLSEAAHMVDFFYINDTQREAIWDAYHSGQDTQQGHHGHDWFDVGTYWDYVGESLMSGFVMAYSDVAVSLDSFNHKSTPDTANAIRRILTPELVETPPDVPETPQEPPVAEPEVPTPQPEPEEPTEPPTSAFFATRTGKTFHDSHKNMKGTRFFNSYHDAEDAGLRPCRTCKPQHHH